MVENLVTPSRIGKIQIPTHLLITSEAFDSLQKTCAAAGDNETGGVLVGCRVRFEQTLALLVFYASAQGTGAVQTPNYFAPDVAFLQAELDKVSLDFAQQGVPIGFLGLWHRHPHDYPQLSAEDITQAREILKDSDYGLIYPELLIPIALFLDNKLTFNPYYIAEWLEEPRLLNLLVCAEQDLLDLLAESKNQELN